MNLAERKKKFRQGGPWCSLGISAFALAAVFFVLLATMMADFLAPECDLCIHTSVDLAHTDHAVELAGARRWDALEISVERDGSLFLKGRKIEPKKLSARLQDGIRNGSERKVYIRADMRSKYGAVVEVIDAVHDAGIEDIAFITEQRRPIH